MSTGLSSSTPSTAQAEKLGLWDFIVIVLLMVGATCYYAYFIGHREQYSINFFLFGIYEILCLIAIAGGYMLIRQHESGHGEWSWQEMLGTMMIATGIALWILLLLPPNMLQSIEEAQAIKPLPPHDPPLVQINAENKASIIEIERITAGTDKVFILLEMAPKKAQNGSIKVPSLKIETIDSTSVHGKIWFHSDNRNSRATDF